MLPYMYIDMPEYKQQVLLTHSPQMYLTPEPRHVLKIIKKYRFIIPTDDKRCRENAAWFLRIWGNRRIRKKSYAKLTVFS